MLKMFDLIKIAERIEAGKPVDSMSVAKALMGPDTNIVGCSWHTITVEQAVGGSLDAVKELHKAALPGWAVKYMGDDEFTFLTVWDGPAEKYTEGLHFPGNAPTAPAAWLAAILRAKTSVDETPQRDSETE